MLQPDLLYYGPKRAKLVRDCPVDAPPDLVIEVSSPSTRRRDIGVKTDLYARFGVPEYWFVDLDAGRVELFGLESGRYGEPRRVRRREMLGSVRLPAFAVAVDQIVGVEDDPSL